MTWARVLGPPKRRSNVAATTLRETSRMDLFLLQIGSLWSPAFARWCTARADGRACRKDTGDMGVLRESRISGGDWGRPRRAAPPLSITKGGRMTGKIGRACVTGFLLQPYAVAIPGRIVHPFCPDESPGQSQHDHATRLMASLREYPSRQPRPCRQPGRIRGNQHVEPNLDQEFRPCLPIGEQGFSFP
jgi:hypothetical protein